MEFIDNLVMPQSGEHMALLKDLLILTYLIFIPYLSLLLGSTLLSVFYSRKGTKENNPLHLRFAKEMIDIVTFNKSAAFGFGIVPAVSALFCYAQLFHGSVISLSGYFAWIIVLMLIAFVFLYSYKYSFHLKDIFSSLKANADSLGNLEREDFEEYNQSSAKLYSGSGKYALVFLLLAAYVFSGALQLSFKSQAFAETPSAYTVLFSASTVTYFAYLLILSLAMISVAVLFVYFRPNSEKHNHSDEFLTFVRKNASAFSLIFILAIPLALVMNFVTKPHESLSGAVFILTGAAMIALLILAALFYVMLKHSSTKYSTSALFFFLIIFSVLIVKDQLAFSTSAQIQYYTLSAQYEDYRRNMLEELGLVSTAASGEEIFHGRCQACHAFDKKIVGPPYNETLVKYEGNQDALVKFVLNPVKVNPDYPPMPNQGLKPKEAKAIAEYILQVYEQNKK